MGTTRLSPGQDSQPPDPYKTCEDRCNHDLVRGITIEQLLGPSDGEYVVPKIGLVPVDPPPPETPPRIVLP